jgi:two-component system, OmpR family, sensor histidine kinase BaeS
MIRYAALASVVVVAAVAIADGLFDPSAAERTDLVILLAATATAGLFAYGALDRRISRNRSIATSIAAAAGAAIALTAGAVAFAAATMTISPHDSRVVLVVLATAASLASALAIAIGHSARVDLRKVSDAARSVVERRGAVDTGVVRRDEIGSLANTVEVMSARLADVDDRRARSEASRLRLIAGIGHDLRTPLTSMRAAVEAMQDGVVVDIDRFLRIMASDVALLGTMVDDLFLLAHAEAGDLQLDVTMLDLTELVETEIAAMRLVAAKATLDIECDARASIRIAADDGALRRVLRNVLGNAVRYAPAHSVVRVTVGSEDGFVRLGVFDDGPGFPPEFRDLAFDAGTRADCARARDAGGAGLGLAIARAFVVAHGGEISIEDGTGGRLVIELPHAALP